jgi:hypothetical protein
VDGPVELRWQLSDGELVETAEPETVDGLSLVEVVVPEEATALSVVDAYGNMGWLDL